MGKLRSRPKSAVFGIEGAREEGPRLFERLRSDDLVSTRLGLQALQCRDERLALLAQLGAVLRVEVTDSAKNFLEGGQSEARRPGKVGAAKEGDPVLMVQEHR